MPNDLKTPEQAVAFWQENMARLAKLPEQKLPPRAQRAIAILARRYGAGHIVTFLAQQEMFKAVDAAEAHEINPYHTAWFQAKGHAQNAERLLAAADQLVYSY